MTKGKHTFRSSPPHAGRIDATDLSTTPTAGRTVCLQLTRCFCLQCNGPWQQGRQEARLHHVVGEREESRDGGRAEKDRGELKRERWTMTSHLVLG